MMTRGYSALGVTSVLLKTTRYHIHNGLQIVPLVSREESHSHPQVNPLDVERLATAALPDRLYFLIHLLAF